jgi:hypothetical protein
VRQPFGLRLQMAGNTKIDPVLDLGGEKKDFEGHGSIPVQFLELSPREPISEPGVGPAP